jgi:CheY-like chemotaxis protein
MLRFSVFDTGPGVNQARRTTIFHDFELGDASSTRRHEGTGLGLAISRRIVEHMGGKLWLEQSGPEGSQFCFEIPLQRAASAIARESGPHLLDRRILIVGDSPFGCGYLARRLSNLGARTNIARDQEQAASILKSGTFALDFLIVDCSLGEKAIDELSKAARTFPDCKSVLLFSPFERRAFGDSMLKSFDGWLVKPVRMESIGTKLVYCTSPRDPETGRLAVERPEPDLTGKRFLLAEDNDVNALLVEMQLRKLGAIVRRANDGREAVMLVEDSFSGAIPTFHAVLMDLRMPNLDGLAATKEIRAIERSQNRKPLSIVALTADAFEDDREAALSAGMQTFLTKPVDLSTLVQVLSDLDVQH